MAQDAPLSIKASIHLEFKDSQICEFAYNTFLPEFNRLKTKRSQISMEKQENSLIFQMESKDITAFRATISEIIALGKIVENTFELTK